MPVTTQDVELFQLVHELLQESRGYQLGERRDRPRASYDCVQLIAPYDGLTMPSQAQFRRAHCRDLASGGFSFFAEQPPDADRLIVALGSVPFTFFVAEVVRVKRSDVDHTGSYLVGCRFVERLTTPSDERGATAS